MVTHSVARALCFPLSNLAGEVKVLGGGGSRLIRGSLQPAMGVLGSLRGVDPALKMIEVALYESH